MNKAREGSAWQNKARHGRDETSRETEQPRASRSFLMLPARMVSRLREAVLSGHWRLPPRSVARETGWLQQRDREICREEGEPFAADYNREQRPAGARERGAKEGVDGRDHQHLSESDACC